MAHKSQKHTLTLFLLSFIIMLERLSILIASERALLGFCLLIATTMSVHVVLLFI